MIKSRPALRYFGGKWRLADDILQHFPKHTIYLEPCFGGGSILLKKSRAKIETVNDKYDQIVNFFDVLRTDADTLVHLIKLTPWSRTELSKLPSEATDRIEKARRFWFHSWATIANTEKNYSFRVCKSPTAQPANITLDADYLFTHAQRLIGVQIENMDALTFMEKYYRKGAFIYFDPPYPKETRVKKNEYVHDSTQKLHEDAAELLRYTNALAIVSGYRCELYDRLYGDWIRIDINTTGNSGSKRVESLWLSPELIKINQQKELFQ